MKHKESNFFWVSYSDLMTSLFFVMLTLYVLTVALLKYKQKATEEQLRKIKEIQNATKALPQRYFEYQDKYKRFSLKEQISFGSGSDVIPTVKYQYLTKVGQSIQKLIVDLREKYAGENIKYLIIIEGMASRDPRSGKSQANIVYNYKLSYERALALKQFWEDNNIVLDPKICEVIISGSGLDGVGREENEVLNQRFLIQIIPKIGKIEEL